MAEAIIACNLDALTPAQRERRAALARRIERRAGTVAESESGFRLELPNDPALCEDVLSLILLERRCCPFLTLSLDFEPGDAPVHLCIGGPPGVKDFLRQTGLLGCASCGA